MQQALQASESAASYLAACNIAKESCEAGAQGVANAGAVATTAALTALQNALNSVAFARIVPVGVPFPCFTEARTAGTLLCDGQTFSATEYPELAAVYPSLALPDLRGVVLRGLDRGKGLDVDGVGRTLGSYQEDAFQGHKHIFGNGGTAGGNPLSNCTGSYAMPWTYSDGNYPQSNYITVAADGSHGTPRVGSETRMKNTACDWLVYAKTPVVTIV